MNKEKAISQIRTNLLEGATNIRPLFKDNREYEQFIDSFMKDMEATENEEYLNIVNNFDETSFMQYDFMLMLLATYCKNNFEKEKIIEFRKEHFLRNILYDPTIRDLITFKKTLSYSDIEDLILNNPKVFKDSYADELFSYHMGYNDAYDFSSAIEEIVNILLTDEEKDSFKNFQEAKEKAKKEEEDKALREYYLKRHHEKKK